MTELSKKTCSACEIGAPLVPHDEQLELLKDLDGWIIDNSDISKLIKEFKDTQFLGTLLFVNSGSEDNSLSLIEKSGYPYISLEKNLGVGNAIVQGIQYGLDNFMDEDEDDEEETKDKNFIRFFLAPKVHDD